MRTFCYILIISIFTISCDNSKGGKSSKVSEVDTKSPKRFTTTYDLDNNGVLDSFQINGEWESEIENLDIWFNKKKFAFTVEEVSFEKFEDKKILSKNLIKNNYFLFIQLTPSKRGLLMRDRGDFAGEAHYLYTYENGDIERIWFGQETLVEINDLDGDNKLEFVTETSTGEPGYKDRYDFVDYTVFKVFSIKELKPNLDTALSNKYNLAHKPDFQKAMLMKDPVLGKDTSETYEKYRLMDLENLPK